MKRNLSISRRDFLKGSAAATAALASLSLVGCDSTKVTETTAGSASVVMHHKTKGEQT